MGIEHVCVGAINLATVVLVHAYSNHFILYVLRKETLSLINIHNRVGPP